MRHEDSNTQDRHKSLLNFLIAESVLDSKLLLVSTGNNKNRMEEDFQPGMDLI